MIHQHDHRGFVTAPGIPIAHKIKETHGPQTDASLSSHKSGSLDMTTPGVILATPVSNNWSRFPSWAPTLRSKPRTGHRRAWETHRPAGARDICNWTVGISESENNTCTPCQVDPPNTLVDRQDLSFWGFPGGPALRLCFHRRGHSFNPLLGN